MATLQKAQSGFSPENGRGASPPPLERPESGQSGKIDQLTFFFFFFTDIHFEVKLSIMTIKNIVCHKLEVIVQINITKNNVITS